METDEEVLLSTDELWADYKSKRRAGTTRQVDRPLLTARQVRSRPGIGGPPAHH